MLDSSLCDVANNQEHGICSSIEYNILECRLSSCVEFEGVSLG